MTKTSPKVAYLDCPTGLSGDMCLGALVHAGVPLEYLTEQLGRLGIAQEYHLRAEFVHRNGQQATKVHVELLGRLVPVAHPSPSTHSPQGTYDQESHRPHLHPHQHQHHEFHPADHSHAHHAPEPHSRHLPAIEQIISAAALPERVKQWSLAIFRRLAEAEGAVHGISPEQVHFHEVGATDAIVDIVGTCIGLDWLGIEYLYCAPLPVGGGTVWAAHGRLPVPPPAVLKLWEMRQVPIYSNGIDHELVTPTGAAIVTTLATEFGAPPAMVLQKVGLGAGAKDLPIPNILRLWIGEVGQSASLQAQVSTKMQTSSPLTTSPSTNLPATNHLATNHLATNLLTTTLQQETIAVLETQIDDLNPQAIGYVMAQLLTAGALDVFTQAVGMKKSRPGVLLTVLCDPAQIACYEAILFRETTTLGIRRSQQQRTILARSIETVETPYGSVRIKVAQASPQQILNVQPEYEDCAQLAQQQNIPWREVHRLALQTWHSQKTHQKNADSVVLSQP